MTKKQCGQVSSHVAAATVLLPPHTADNSCAVSNTYGTRYICVCATQVPHCGTQTETHCLVQLIVTHFYSMGNITHIIQIPHYSRLAS